MANRNLANAKSAKNDEFYTQLEDINRELYNYVTDREDMKLVNHFKDKVVFCNCDDPEWSNFWEYFYDNFKLFKLKKLISTHYVAEGISYKLEYTGTGEPVKTELKGNGDFRSDECIELLKESDIVVTNPPFSLFREYVATLMQYNKKFVIMGNNNAITYKEIFPLIKDNKMWLGYSANKTLSFVVPESYSADLRNDKGKKIVKVPAISWFTNLDIPKRKKTYNTYNQYKGHEKDYPKYDNYDAINVNKCDCIPCDYEGVMGVPITFLDKYNPEQYEIVNALNRYILIGNEELNCDIKNRHSHACNINGNSTYFRILIKKKEGKKNEN